MITQEIPVIDNTLSEYDSDQQYLASGLHVLPTNPPEIVRKNVYEELSDDDAPVYEQTDDVEHDANPDPAPVSLDSAQHLLQSISSDEGSRSPSSSPRSPVVPGSSANPNQAASKASPQANVESASSRPALFMTIEDLCNSEGPEIASMVSKLVLHDRHSFISRAIKGFSHGTMLSLIRSESFMSVIQRWCRDAIQDQDAALICDILHLVELLPAPNASCVLSFFQFLSDSDLFAETDSAFVASRILDRWTARFPNQLDKLSGSKVGFPDSTASSSSGRLNIPGPKSHQNYRNRRFSSNGPQGNLSRKPALRQLSPSRSTRRREPEPRRAPVPRQQSPPRRPSPPRRSPSPGATSSKIPDHTSGDKRSHGVSHLFPRSSFPNGRHHEDDNLFEMRSGSQYGANRSSFPYPRESQRSLLPSSSSPSLRDHYSDHRVTNSHRFDPSSKSRTRDALDMDPTVPYSREPSKSESYGREQSKSSAYGREPWKIGPKYDSHPETDSYTEPSARSDYARSDSFKKKNSIIHRGESGFVGRVREATPGAYRSVASDSRSKYSYDDVHNRSEHQVYLLPLDERSVPARAVRSLSPLPHRDDDRMYMSDSQRRYDNSNLKRDVLKNNRHDSRDEKSNRRDEYQDSRHSDDKDFRHSESKDYRREISKDFRQNNPHSFSRHDAGSKSPTLKRKPDFRTPRDGGYNKAMRLSDEERRDLVLKGACLYCRKPGHTIDNCRTRPARS